MQDKLLIKLIEKSIETARNYKSDTTRAYAQGKIDICQDAGYITRDEADKYTAELEKWYSDVYK